MYASVLLLSGDAYSAGGIAIYMEHHVSLYVWYVASVCTLLRISW